MIAILRCCCIGVPVVRADSIMLRCREARNGWASSALKRSGFSAPLDDYQRHYRRTGRDVLAPSPVVYITGPRAPAVGYIQLQLLHRQ
jgi:hypothetical protein